MPSTRTKTLAVAGITATAVLGGGATWALTRPEPSSAAPAANPATAARTSFSGLTPATGEPTLPGLKTAAPRPGAVAPLAGPFDDRFTFGPLRLESGTVTGRLKVTSDVSDLLELQVLAGFYDRSGTFLGLGRHTHHLIEDGHTHTGPPTETEHFAITAPAKIRNQVASATVGVPVLVNE